MKRLILAALLALGTIGPVAGTVFHSSPTPNIHFAGGGNGQPPTG